MRILQQFVTDPDRCEYLPDRESSLAYYVAAELAPAEYEALMDRGFRKFGPFLFRPVCRSCTACRPIRIPVAEFRPDRSQRRAAKANAGLQVRYAPPTVDEERLELYRRYHAAQAELKGWPDTDREWSSYEMSFVRNPLPSVEISLWEGERLRAVVLTDLTPNVVSGIYHYYEPELKSRSIGTYCMLQTLELARKLGKRWSYFGFYVDGCGSLAYKARFQPCEIMGEDGVWRPYDPQPSLKAEGSAGRPPRS